MGKVALLGLVAPVSESMKSVNLPPPHTLACGVLLVGRMPRLALGMHAHIARA